jgi:hypothetical protein
MIYAIFMCGKSIFDQIKFGSDERFEYEFARVSFQLDKTDDVDEASEILYKYITLGHFNDDLNKMKEAGRSKKDIIKTSRMILHVINTQIDIAKLSDKEDSKWTYKLIRLRDNDFFKYAPVSERSIAD